MFLRVHCGSCKAYKRSQQPRLDFCESGQETHTKTGFLQTPHVPIFVPNPASTEQSLASGCSSSSVLRYQHSKSYQDTGKQGVIFTENNVGDVCQQLAHNKTVVECRKKMHPVNTIKSAQIHSCKANKSPNPNILQHTHKEEVEKCVCMCVCV